MSNTGARIKPEAIREVAFGDITGSFVAMGSEFLGPIRIIYVANDTDQDVYLSDNTTTAKWRVKSNSFRLLDLKTNDIFFNEGQSIYLSAVSALPTSGLVWVEAAYS